jgi:Cdc6-like AAA superfamily ATPase
MKISELKVGERAIVEFCIDEEYNGKIPLNTYVHVLAVNGRYYLKTPADPALISLRFESVRMEERLSVITTKRMHTLCTIIDYNRSMGKLTSVVIVFPQKQKMDLEISMNDDFIKKIHNWMPTKGNQPDNGAIIDGFAKEMLLDGDEGRKIAIMGIHTGYLQNKENKEEYTSDFLLCSQNGYIQFRLETEEPLPGSPEPRCYYRAEKIIFSVDKRKYRFFLIEGLIQFVDHTKRGLAKAETLRVMEASKGSAKSYLNIWNDYAQADERIAFKAMDQIGLVSYDDTEKQPNGQIRLRIGNGKQLERLRNHHNSRYQYTICPQQPPLDFQSGVTMDSYEKIADWANQEKITLTVCRITGSIRRGDNYISIELIGEEDVYHNQGYLFLNLGGNVSSAKRRRAAKENIMTGNAGMPQLYAILEGKRVSLPSARKMKALSSTLKQEIFAKNPPNESQIKAIEIAMNTPDIALIQGPPGTGKTTVITAILKRLQEENQSSSEIKGKNLVSAYQHDAVQNVIDKIEILGIPAIKFGGRSSEKSERVVMENTVQQKIEEMQSNLRRRHSNILESQYISKFDDIRLDYLCSTSNTDKGTLMRLEKVRELTLGKIGSLAGELDALIDEMRERTVALRDMGPSIKPKIHALPENPASFHDKPVSHTGIEKFEEMRYRLSKLAKKDETYSYEVAVLDEILSEFSRSGESEGFYSMIRTFKHKFLLKMMKLERRDKIVPHDDRVVKLLGKISDTLSNAFDATLNGEEQILLRYIQEFESRPLSIRNTMEEYLSVFGATNQQAVGREIGQIKGKNAFYDNVIVDEAARSNPMDLFIPMSLATDRVILVGDHRQLPHIVDDRTIEEMETRDGDDLLDIAQIVDTTVKKSLFEHLFTLMREREKSDRVKRTITLDTQYRTIGVLGDFISRNFYERHGESKIYSVLPDELFAHGFTEPGLEKKACVFLDVPNRNNGEERSGNSWHRPAEAEAIAKHISGLLSSEEGKDLTFGIITFYSAQVNSILEALSYYDITEKDKNEKAAYVLKERYKRPPNKKEDRLRIGTVDSFQGMEFDVVYLSMVRSNQNPLAVDERQKLRKFGHLKEEPRLCVSMSRQKKLLIVVGDSAMLAQSDAQEVVPALVDYYSLCKNDKKYGSVIPQ